MGQKVHPIGFRLGFIKDWQAKWYEEKRNYATCLHEDFGIRRAIGLKYRDVGISRVDIEREANSVTVTIHTSRPGIVIGRGGQRVEELRSHLEKLARKKVRVNIQEILEPELDAYLVARSVASQIERRIFWRRAMKQAIFRSIQRGAKGIKISCSGRLGGAEIARREIEREGSVPLHTLRADVDYGFAEAHTTMGCVGIKVWIYKGDVLPQPKEKEERELQPSLAAPILKEEEHASTEESKASQSA
jgi:small subunit ribosomal protein S3